MESSQASLLAQAKQGDAKAIATLLNHKLQSKGIIAKASVKNSCLHIMLEAAKTPAQRPLVDFLQKSFVGFTVDNWHVVKVYGRRVGEDIPDWVEEFKVRLEPSQAPEALAKRGNVKAIATLINQELKLSGVIAKVSLKTDCLQVMLEAAEAPNQEQMISLLQPMIQKLEIQSITRLSVYGKHSEEDFPDWQEEVQLLLDNSEPRQVQTSSLDLTPSSKSIALVSASSVAQEVDGIGLSNQLYTALQTTCYQHLAHKVGSESDKTIHEIVENFVDAIEAELKLDLDQFSKQVIDIAKAFGLQPEQTEIQAIVSDTATSNFAGIRLAIRDLERVTREVLQTNFPQETDALKSFFSGAAQEFTANLFGRTTMSTEGIVGTVLGSIIAPGLGSVIGGAIGQWMGGNKQQKALQAIIEKYQKAREKLFQEWEAVLQVVYTKLGDFFTTIAPLKLLTYQVMNQAVVFYNEANSYLETEEELQKAIDLYDKAICLNRGLALAWNNKGYVLNHLEKYEEALPALIQAIQIDQTLIIAFNNLGDALQSLGRNEEAIAAYEESIKLASVNYQAWWGKGTCLYNLQRYQEAIAVGEKLVELDSENFLGWYTKAVCHALLGDDKLAIENLREAVKIDSDSSQKLAKADSDFDRLREDKQFKELMESSVGANYTSLKGYLKENQWREADQETARLIKWVIQKITNSTEVNQETLKVFPCADLETIDFLWQENSDGKFGFSVQKIIFQESYKNRDIFGSKTGWRVKDADGNWSWRSNANFAYNPESMPDGHLPSSLWAGEDGWFENRRDRLLTLFARIDSCSLGDKDSES
ncbi:GUN4 domain-containing protein [Coleofasciculus sp. FACHB-712]|uniref:GUN4 domain-containing protein n=1 Tax=Coleofasciculus sp. FACHB-712 TaxID=2692789 RepID=UPI0016837A4B|nr:GUN4 domain-containing protein [Coleofasciculus sp. FACHB-712]MBD1943261.1 GUN4 domain-containing protein [Coleofasciculus sp. FACHB-712]